MDRDFVYVSSDKTDIRKTFERVREELKALAERERQCAEERLRKTIQLRKAK